MILRCAWRHSLVALVLSVSCVIPTSFAAGDVIYNETWAGAYTADVSAINFGWATYTTNAALNTALTTGINTVNASFPRSSPLQQNVASPYPGNPSGTTTTPDLARGYLFVGNSNAPQFQWTNEYLTFGNTLGVDPTAGPVSFSFSIANNTAGRNARLAIQLAGGSWYASNATYTSGAFAVAALGGTPQPVVPTFSVDFSTVGSLWRDLAFDGTMSINAADGRGTATAGTVLNLAAAARSTNLPAGNIIGWGLYWEPDGNTGGNRRADNFMVIQEAPAIPPTRFLTWNNVPGGGNGSIWDIGTTANWNSASPTTPFVYLENDAVTFNDSNNGNYTVTLDTAVKPGGVTVNTTGTYTIQGTGSIGGGHGLTLTAGTLILATDNNYSGGTVINAGTLRIGNGGTSGRFGTKDVTNNGTLIINRSDAVSFANLITGTGSVVQSGTGTTTLSGASSYSGGLTVNSGAVRLGGSGAGTGTITANTGTTVVFGGALTNPVSLAGATVGVAAASPLNGDITAAASTNSTIYLADPQNLPTAAADVTEVAFTKSLLGSGNITVLSNGQDNSPDAGNGFRLRGTVASTFSGRLTIGNNVKAELQTTVAGPTTFSPLGAGTVVMTAGDAQLGDTLLSTTTTGYSELNLRNNTLATETIRDVIFGNNMEVAGTGVTFLNALSDTNAPEGAKVTMGNLKIGTGQELALYKGAGAVYAVEFPSVTLTGNATFSPRKPGFGAATSVGGDLILSNIGQSVGGSGITMAGVRTLTLTGSSTYTGPTNIESGTVVVTGSLSTAGAVNVNSGVAPATLTGTGSMGNLTVTSGTVSPGTAAAPIGTLTVQSVQPSFGTFLMQISGATADRLNVTGAASLAGSTLTIALPTPATPGTYTLFSAGTVNSLPTLSNPNIGRTNFALAQVGGNVNVTVTGAPASIRWDNTGSAGDGTTWDTQANQNWKNGAVSDQFFEADNVLFNDTNNGKYTVNVSGPVLPASVAVNNSSGDYVFNGGDIGGITSLVKNGARALTLNNASTFSGGVVLNQGTLGLGAAGFGATGPIGSGRLTINGGSIDNAAGFDLTLATNNPQTWAGSFAFAGTNNLNLGTGAVTLNGSPVVTVAANTLTVGGIISDGSGNSLGKAGSGILVLSGANTYTGTTDVTGGTLRVTAFAALGAIPGGAVNVSSGGSVDVGGITGNNAAGGFGQKQVNIAGPGVNIGGVDYGALANSSATVQQQNAFQKVKLTANATIGNPGSNVTNNPGRFDIRAAQANGVNVAQLDLDGKTLTKIGTNTISLVAVDVTPGDIVVNGGAFSFETTTRVLAANKPDTTPYKLQYNTGSTIGLFNTQGGTTITRNIEVNGDVNIQNGQTTSTSTIGSPINLNGPATVLNMVQAQSNNATANGPITLTGVISGQGSIVKQNTAVESVLTLSGNNTYQGTTTINGGFLQLGASERIPNGSNLTLGAGGGSPFVPATFRTAGFSETLGTLSLTGGGALDLGAGASVVNFATSNISTNWNFNTLTINNWTPGSDRVFFGNSASGLGTIGPTEATQIVFPGYTSGFRILSTGEVIPALPGTIVQGDFNLDGALTPADIQPMLKALTNVQAFKSAYALSDPDFNTITNLDSNPNFTNRDIQNLLNRLATLGFGSVEAVPEPTSFALLGLGMAGALILKKKRR